MTETIYKTHQIWIKKGHRMYPYFSNMTQNAKNMYNTTNFFIRQVYTGLKTDKPLQPLQKEALDLIDKNLDKMNDNQVIAYQKNLAKEKAKPKNKRKEVHLNAFSNPTKEKPYVNYGFLDCLYKLTNQNDYVSLPKQSSQWVMKNAFNDWKSFFAGLKEYKQNPEKFLGKPKIPRYSRAKEKEIKFTNQDCVIKDEKYLKFPFTKDRLNIGKLGMNEGKLKEVRVVPNYGNYTVELIFEVKKEVQMKELNDRLMSIDIVEENLATIVTNTGLNPVLVKGNNIKSINQFYNKMRAHYLGILRQGKKTNEGPFTSKRLLNLDKKRFLKLKDIFHKASFYIVNLALKENVDTIIIGKNLNWKQEINIGKRNNQNFVSIPHNLLINMIEYKACEYGIKVIKAEESYTSKASFLDEDAIPVYKQGSKTKHTFSGKRIGRGVYRSKDGIKINADVNGSGNIMRKTVFNVLKHKSFDISKINVFNPKSKIII